MNRFLTIVLATTLSVVGCTHVALPMTAERKEELRKSLVPKFVAASVPKEKEEDFYRVLEAFSHRRQSFELVQRVEFISRNEATLVFTDTSGWGHGGGVAGLKMKGGRWRVVLMANPISDPIYAPTSPGGLQKTEPNQSLQPTGPSARG